MIYNNVISYCTKNNISVSAFEKMCNIGNGTVRGWKGNSSSPSISTLEKMQKATGIPVAKWIESDNDNN